MSRSTTALLLASTAVLATPAFAGTLEEPTVDVVQPAPAAPVAAFQGFSIYGGATFGSNNYDVVGEGNLTTGGMTPSPDSYDFDFNLPDLGGEGVGAIFGVGYDFQPTGNFVYGVFLDYARSENENDTSVTVTDGVDSAAFNYDLTQTSALTAAGRVGYTPSQTTLIYGLLGFTKAKWEGQYSATSTGSLGGSGSYDFDNEGFTVGLGIETFVTENMTLRVEYRHTSFDDYNLLDIGTAPQNYADVDMKTNSQSAAALLSYRF